MKTALNLIFLFFFASCDVSLIDTSSQRKAIDLSTNQSEESNTPSLEVDVNNDEVIKPYGVFTSMPTTASVAHSGSRGALIRTSWSKIEPSPGVFDFSDIDNQILDIKNNSSHKQQFFYSLAVSAGCGEDPQNPLFPKWLYDLGVETMPVSFRAKSFAMPKMWDYVVQYRLQLLADALAAKYNTDSNLQLVYIPQLTGNGIEGHFNGNDSQTLISNGLTEDIWVSAVKSVAKYFAKAFDTKAIAIEIHEVIGSSRIPERIINELYEDPETEKRIGLGIWWLSGGVGYQTELIQIIKDFPGDKYGQVIGNSSQPCRFGDSSEDYRTVFTQAIELGIRYIEPWNYEFDYNTQDQNMDLFNSYAYEKYVLNLNPSIPSFESPNTSPSSYCD